ncbi:anthranilate/aminodeoxychorismate synthase component II [Leptospira perolatii]|uniref:Anthranilate/aminodeoxychorismate synthase component II n=1 Tax=Leptospira perolatii TaxID=2023191 RepID=A0A2M9ZIK7_9LEPT|nr:aminodeoxychorismate/anthranilate synthase component II [Leptospira perolatii]PJZ68472.1 anthranilate/aminodeoxychorismate synthase component II [Leptospira perolatii]PJZ71900.1 anthranilate/aminodeoxychorismate synthase component II [Leptospira perolatii]
MRVLLIDHYDSFTYNLFQMLGEILEAELGFRFRLDVFRHDEVDFRHLANQKYERIVLSPGPGTPEDPSYFGISSKILSELGSQIPILGVCLGMQGMANFGGAKIVRAKFPMHGKVSEVRHDQKGVFQDLPNPIRVMRYHSLVVESSSLSEEWEKSCFAGEELMGIRHKEYPMEGIQFHPESFATVGGKHMLRNFLFGKQEV